MGAHVGLVLQPHPKAIPPECAAFRPAIWTPSFYSFTQGAVRLAALMGVMNVKVHGCAFIQSLTIAEAC